MGLQLRHRVAGAGEVTAVARAPRPCLLEGARARRPCHGGFGGYNDSGMHAPPVEVPITLRCRRCGKLMTLASQTALPCCPHCGAVVRPWVPRLRDNKNAAILAFLALGFLTAGILLPFMSMSKLGMETSFSMLAGIRELYERGHALLAAILLE